MAAERQKIQRIPEVDFIKAVMILLMVVFHLVFIGDSYPYLKKLVYTFHMPAFLVISGYMLNPAKGWRQYLTALLWIFIPYGLMESLYVGAAALLPIREHVDNLTVSLFFDKLFFHPIGPYWYLHTMMICGLSCFAVMRLPKATLWMKALILGVIYWLLSEVCGLLSLSNALYFLAGALLRNASVPFLKVVRPSLPAIIPFTLIAVFLPQFHDRASVVGIALVYCAMSFCAALCSIVPERMRNGMLYLGRHTLEILVFSPVFTLMSKIFQPQLVAVDPSGILFMVVAVIFTVAGSLLITMLLDCVGINFLNPPKR